VARFSRLEVLNTMIEIGLVPLFYSNNEETAEEIVRACAAGGAKVVELRVL